ncbi:hypothetical protein PsYK624_147030 [Phanerochaete sordida]|uniref:Uncharacterized protein n=1 Tax=Phanerochaete sordida TaxID=48140 RepID=A0A9P3LKF4_9APHY|nr:hypothetical protein PsYK624_147030 [Phanerochaete sordida]
MVSRFTSAAVVEHGRRTVEGLHMCDPATPPSEEENTRMGAMRAGMYGVLTRETTSWAPARLARSPEALRNNSLGTRRGAHRTPLGLALLMHLRAADFANELADYAQAAAISQPLAGAMVSCFTSVAVVEHGRRAVQGLHPRGPNGGSETVPEALRRERYTPAQGSRGTC